MQATIMVVSVTASTTSGSPLSEADLGRVLGAADAALSLDGDKAAILQLVQLKMHQIAPNLSTALGTEISAKLMGVAGGLQALSCMPADNIQVPVLARCCVKVVRSQGASPRACLPTASRPVASGDELLSRRR